MKNTSDRALIELRQKPATISTNLYAPHAVTTFALPASARVRQVTTHAKEEETFSGITKQYCTGLSKIGTADTDCAEGTNCVDSNIFTCVKATTRGNNKCNTDKTTDSCPADYSQIIPDKSNLYFL